jgi:hypothetical protein
MATVIHCDYCPHCRKVVDAAVPDAMPDAIPGAKTQAI